MNFSSEIMEIAKDATDLNSLKTVLFQNHIELAEAEIRELAGVLEISHGYNCPCCSGIYAQSLRYKNITVTPRRIPS